MSFIGTILSNLTIRDSKPALIEIHGKEKVVTTCEQLQKDARRVRGFLKTSKVHEGDRVVLLGPNGSRWSACDLGILMHGAVCVPLYSRQDPKELAFMAQDCEPSLVIVSDESLKKDLCKVWPEACRVALYEEVFAHDVDMGEPHTVGKEDLVTIIYTSGTSGNPKGVMINRGNVDYMLEQAVSRFSLAFEDPHAEQEVFHFLPWCFAGSRIVLWTQLFRGNPLMVSTDLKNLPQEMQTANPEYYLNVPAILERIKTGVGEALRTKGGVIYNLYVRGRLADEKKRTQSLTLSERMSLWLARKIVFPAIKKKIGRNLKFLICGSAALAEETQRWFHMIGIRILQVYGLTETTAIVTIDYPGREEAGKVGHVLEGCEAKVTDEGEMICRGPNIFPGYWKRPEETSEVLKEGWFYTGDQAEVDQQGNWKIVGRVKNILVPESGHNIAPEPLEEALRERCQDIEHVVIVGHGRPHLCAIVTGNVGSHDLNRALDQLNETVPHYKRVRSVVQYAEGFSVENGLLTANQKLKRKVIEQHLEEQLREAYERNARS